VEEKSRPRGNTSRSQLQSSTIVPYSTNYANEHAQLIGVALLDGLCSIRQADSVGLHTVRNYLARSCEPAGGVPGAAIELTMASSPASHCSPAPRARHRDCRRRQDGSRRPSSGGLKSLRLILLQRTFDVCKACGLSAQAQISDSDFNGGSLSGPGNDCQLIMSLCGG
jgi:hypothetical protein